MAIILLIEDDKNIRELIKATFDKKHYVIEAATGQDALKLINLFKPELAILDIMLEFSIPTGAELCTILAKTPQLAGMPILAMSAFADREAISDILLCATDFLSKPFEPDELMSRVDRLVKESESTLTRLLASASEPGIFQAVVEAAMVGNTVKILRALKGAIEQVEGKLGK